MAAATNSSGKLQGEQKPGLSIDSLVKKLPETSRFAVPSRSQSMRVVSDGADVPLESSAMPKAAALALERSATSPRGRHAQVRMGAARQSTGSPDTPDMSVQG
jgi:hypothetical protein